MTPDQTENVSLSSVARGRPDHLFTEEPVEVAESRPTGTGGSLFAEERTRLHAGLLATILTIDAAGVPSNADKGNKASSAIATGVAERLKWEVSRERSAGQTSGNQFEALCATFIRSTFTRLGHLRPGQWDVQQLSSRASLAIAGYEQYAHLRALDRAAHRDPELAAALGSDYTIAPDLVVLRTPETDTVINQYEVLVDDQVATRAPLRAAANKLPLLHASLSCKWTLRSDRAQNARAEALNLIRNRKGHLPHIALITAEPLPSRLASIALGTGDLDCVYHFALYELLETVRSLDYPDAEDMLAIMVDGGRLKDISDLPLDIAV